MPLHVRIKEKTVRKDADGFGRGDAFVRSEATEKRSLRDCADRVTRNRGECLCV